MKTCIATVLYTQARGFLDEFLQSIAAQTSHEFDLLIVNDNYDEDELAALVAKGLTADINVYFYNANDQESYPPLMRMILLEWVKSLGYEFAIFADADDTFVPTRVENILSAHKDSDAAFFYNMLSVKEDDGNLESILKVVPAEMENADEIMQCNFLGMGNTAVDMTKLSIDYIKSFREANTIYFDWYIFSRIVIEIGKGLYVKNADTIYRQHPANALGNQTDLSKEKQIELLNKELDAKLFHCNIMKQYSDSYAGIFDKLKDVVIDENFVPYENSEGYWWNRIRV